MPFKKSDTTTKSEGPSGLHKRRVKKRAFNNYQIYVYKVLKNIHPDIGMSKKAMSVMNSFVSDIFDRIASEASKLVRYHGKQTLSSNDIQSAVKLILPGDLAEHAIAEGTRSLAKYSAPSA